MSERAFCDVCNGELTAVPVSGILNLYISETYANQMVAGVSLFGQLPVSINRYVGHAACMRRITDAFTAIIQSLART